VVYFELRNNSTEFEELEVPIVVLTVAKAVLLATRSGAIKTDICDLTQSIVPPHYACKEC
jgi:hypothetical protein